MELSDTDMKQNELCSILNFIPFGELNSNVIDLNVKPKTVKLLEEKFWRKLLHFWLSNDFLDIAPKAWPQKTNFIIGLH